MSYYFRQLERYDGTMVVLESFEQVKEGFQLGIYSQFQRMREYLSWYRSEYGSLFSRRTPTEANGILLLRPEGVSVDDIPDENSASAYYAQISKQPLFRRASDFYAATAVDSLPAFTGKPDQLDWLDSRTNMITRALQEAAHYWSVVGYSVVVAEGGTLAAVDPRYYLRVGDRANIDELIGHILIYPYYDPMGPSDQADERSQAANRAKVIKCMLDEEGKQKASVQYFNYTSSTLAEPVSSEMAIDDLVIRVFGEGDGFYEAVAYIAMDIMVNSTLLMRDNNRWSNRPQFLTARTTDAVVDKTKSRMEPGSDMADRLREARKYINMIVEVEEGVTASDMYDDTAADTSSRLMYDERLWEQFLWGCGVPGSVFGSGIGKGESGEARAHTQHSAAATVESWRTDVERALPLLVSAMGCPGDVDDIGFTWAVSPFQARVTGELEPADVIELKQNGIISPAEARSLHGFAEREDVSDEISDDMEVMSDGDDESGMAEGGNGQSQRNGFNGAD